MATESNPLREGMPNEITVKPAVLVIFGASGDLTKRKLVPAVYNLALSRLLPAGFAVVGVARRAMPNFADDMREPVSKFSRRKPLDEATWNELAKSMSYVQGEFNDAETFKPVASAQAHRSPSLLLTWLPDGKRLATAGRFDGRLRLWGVP